MNNAKKMTAAERAGHTVGRWLKPIVRLESAIVQRLVAVGLPGWLALALKWTVRLALSVGLLYIAFVSALILLLFVLFQMRRGDAEVLDDEEFHKMVELHDYIDQEEALKPQLREGHSGWGWYSHDDQALDIEYPDDSHH
ncbi:hypothetical protein C4K14_4069 [Pseudomonas chlororaphis subsp. aureofaciens]|uniref:DUF3742 family protein n=1 Tax=Pseudomonas chlororaphis TaxID=587753 RepID=UPI000F56FB36|nr:DUF3742 family protein [Pseudomonas chlororaphis]AZD86891.1 hypothetical protein C4K14_4069 [Pseudomonas chlororaphis subsp. aureofaciens]